MSYLSQWRLQRAQAPLINTERQLKMKILLEASGKFD